MIKPSNSVINNGFLATPKVIKFISLYWIASLFYFQSHVFQNIRFFAHGMLTHTYIYKIHSSFYFLFVLTWWFKSQQFGCCSCFNLSCRLLQTPKSKFKIKIRYLTTLFLVRKNIKRLVTHRSREHGSSPITRIVCWCFATNMPFVKFKTTTC